MRQMKPLLEKGYRFEILPPGALSRPCPFCGGEELGLEFCRSEEYYYGERDTSLTSIIASVRVKCCFCDSCGPTIVFQCRDDCEDAVESLVEAMGVWGRTDFSYRPVRGKLEVPE